MKVSTCKEVEIAVDVDLDDVIYECFDRVADDEARMRNVAGAITAALRILTRVPDKIIDELPDSAKATVRERLAIEMKRYSGSDH